MLEHLPSTGIHSSAEWFGNDHLTDLHIWQVGVGKFAAIVGVVAHHPKTAEEYRQALKIHEELVHVTVEVQTCQDHEIIKCG